MKPKKIVHLFFFWSVSIILLLLTALLVISQLYGLTPNQLLVTQAVAFVVFLIIELILLKKLIRPFKRSFENIRKYNHFKVEVPFEESRIFEANELNRELNHLTHKVFKTFQFQKQYSENLSHELLTPLTIIRTKAELMLQKSELTKSDLTNIDTILKTVSRLSKLNQGLILLSKIENNQFVDVKMLDINSMLEDSMELFEDQIRAKNIEVRIEKNFQIQIVSNFNLTQILLNNIVKNAIVHNVEDGFLRVQILENSISIKNSGKENSVPESELFERFVSNSKSSKSIGLGLSIVKQICDLLHFSITYESLKEEHQVLIKLPKG